MGRNDYYFQYGDFFMYFIMNFKKENYFFIYFHTVYVFCAGELDIGQLHFLCLGA